MADLNDLDKPLTTKILSNPEHKITKHILYIYSMESFIYGEMNQASREKDKSKIQYYGAYAAALGYSINYAHQNRDEDITQGSNLYRGLTLPNEQVDKFIVGQNVNLTGYTSTSLEFETALGFATDE